MPKIELPTLNTRNFTVNSVYLKGDDASVSQYCLDNGKTLIDYEVEHQRFSNDGALLYSYYDTANAEWKTEFGFSKIAIILNVEEPPVA